MLVYVLEIHCHTQQYLTTNMAKILYDSFGGSREMLACHQPQVNYMTFGFGRLSLHGIFPGIAGQNQTPTIGSYRVQPSTIWLVSSPCLRAVTRQLENDQEISMSIFLKCQPIRDDLPLKWTRKKPPGTPTHWVAQGDYDVMWGEFPGSKDVPRCMNHVKILGLKKTVGTVSYRYKFGIWGSKLVFPTWIKYGKSIEQWKNNLLFRFFLGYIGDYTSHLNWDWGL